MQNCPANVVHCDPHEYAPTEEYRDFRRDFLIANTLLAASVLLATSRAHAFSLADLTATDASAGIKSALDKGAEAAIKLLGKQDGFWANDKVRIALPDWLAKAEKAIKLIGRGKELDALKLGINRAAEQAIPQSKQMLSNAVKSMTLTDAKAILTGGENSVTKFFQEKTQAPLTEKFLPVVAKVTDRIGLAKQYNSFAQQLASTGFIKVSPEQSRVERHVTAKALDGLYHVISDEEKKLRANPAGAASDLLRRVFGALK